MAIERLDLDSMADTLVEWLATGTDVTGEDRQRARDALEAIGAPTLLDTLDMAERVIRFGNSFHSVAGFFADGTAEQKYVRSITEGRA